MRTFLNATDAAGRLWIPGTHCRLHDGSDSAGLNSGEIDGDAGTAPTRLPDHAGRYYSVYRPDDCTVLFAVSRHAGLDANSATVHFRYGDVHPVYLNEYHYSGRFN